MVPGRLIALRHRPAGTWRPNPAALGRKVREPPASDIFAVNPGVPKIPIVSSPRRDEFWRGVNRNKIPKIRAGEIHAGMPMIHLHFPAIFCS
jgi:hypothetical protein